MAHKIKNLTGQDPPVGSHIIKVGETRTYETLADIGLPAAAISTMATGTSSCSRPVAVRSRSTSGAR